MKTEDGWYLDTWEEDKLPQELREYTNANNPSRTQADGYVDIPYKERKARREAKYAVADADGAAILVEQDSNRLLELKSPQKKRPKLAGDGGGSLSIAAVESTPPVVSIYRAASTNNAAASASLSEADHAGAMLLNASPGATTDHTRLVSTSGDGPATPNQMVTKKGLSKKVPPAGGKNGDIRKFFS